MVIVFRVDPAFKARLFADAPEALIEAFQVAFRFDTELVALANTDKVHNVGERFRATVWRRRQLELTPLHAARGVHTLFLLPP